METIGVENKMNHEARYGKCLKPFKTNFPPPIDSTHGGFPMDIQSTRLWVTVVGAKMSMCSILTPTNITIPKGL